MMYANSAYIGAASIISQPGAVVPGNWSFDTIDARMRPGISEITFGPSWSSALTPNARPSAMWSWPRVILSGIPAPLIALTAPETDVSYAERNGYNHTKNGAMKY